jgi:hypothetical protein
MGVPPLPKTLQLLIRFCTPPGWPTGPTGTPVKDWTDSVQKSDVFLHTSRLTDGITGTPRKTGLTVCRNHMFVARAFRYQLPPPPGALPPLVRCSSGLAVCLCCEREQKILLDSRVSPGPIPGCEIMRRSRPRSRPQFHRPRDRYSDHGWNTGGAARSGSHVPNKGVGFDQHGNVQH